MRLLLLLFTGILCQSLRGQNDISFELIRSGNTATWICKNSGSVQKSVTLTLHSTKRFRGYSSPITQRINAGEEMVFLVLKHRGKTYGPITYSWNSYNVSPPSESSSYSTAKKVIYTTDFRQINSGIYLFDAPECPNCLRAIHDFLEKGYSFKVIHAAKNTAGHQILWTLLKKQGLTDVTIKMPVILVDGQLFMEFDTAKSLLERRIKE